MYLLGIDIGSSSVKASIVDGTTGNVLHLLSIETGDENYRQTNRAEQAPELWWENLKLSIQDVLNSSKIEPKTIDSIGISYQMHGLVLVDKNQQVCAPPSSGVTLVLPCRNKAFSDLGEQNCWPILNSPGNFTASKLKWVKRMNPNFTVALTRSCYRAITLPCDCRGYQNYCQRTVRRYSLEFQGE